MLNSMQGFLYHDLGLGTILMLVLHLPSSSSIFYFSDASGGISRDWEGYPRKYFQPGAKSFRCACVPEGELENPHFKLYEDCDPMSTSCKLASKTG